MQFINWGSQRQLLLEVYPYLGLCQILPWNGLLRLKSCRLVVTSNLIKIFVHTRKMTSVLCASIGWSPWRFSTINTSCILNRTLFALDAVRILNCFIDPVMRASQWSHHVSFIALTWSNSPQACLTSRDVSERMLNISFVLVYFSTRHFRMIPEAIYRPRFLLRTVATLESF